ncbi:phosphatase PAP2 family protein [Ilumatobacter nonamiensis]|uniref:phosphatase PAP2 family protein n=1 Tax=Ilumatobacter nonamiensis TaxID=467093 RepID=UPI001F4C5A5F|nr:phosphatase PAP2 family protein [Ilumatobacter nonamiensis]
MILAATKWPTWQQAWITMLICIVLYVIVRRIRPSRFTEIAMPVLHELAVLTGLYGLWRTAKKLPLQQTEGAIERARTIVDVQNALGFPTELQLQEFVVDHDPLGWFSAAYYIGMHVPAVFAFLIWMFWRHRDKYPRWRNVLALTTAGCLLIRFWHVAPPRFLTDLGYEDLSEIYNMSVYGAVGTGVSGQFVAMPSIHVAWAAVISFGIIASSTSRWKWLFALHLPVTFLVVSATGHHWWLDGIVAIGLVGLSLLIDEGVRRLWRAWTRRSELGGDGGEQFVEGSEAPELGELGDHVVG